MHARRSTSISFGLAALLALSGAEAGTFSLSPLRVDLSGAVSTAALTVHNDDEKPLVVQAQGLAWSQEGGQDSLTPSRDVLVSPAVFTLASGGSQVVRVALRRPADATRELTYRLALQEVPQAANPGFTGVSVALKLSVPVFVAPQAAAEPRLEWRAERDADGHLVLVARNDGTAHAQVRHVALTAVGSGPTLERPGLAYVLPGATRRWTFDDNDNTRSNATSAPAPARPGPYRLEGTTDRGAFETELTLAGD
jgi:fimbrial chaperone protein